MEHLDDMTSIYRIISLESFLQILIRGKDRYVNPLSWSDTYEGCGLRYVRDDKNIIKILESLYSQYAGEPNCGNRVLYAFAKAESVLNCSFCQCWSLECDSDAMWRIYNYNNHALQIESNKQSIVNSVKMELPCWGGFESNIAIVKYDVKDNDKYTAYNRYYGRGMDFKESFFHKRDAFKHESEVRVLLYPHLACSMFETMLNKYRMLLKDECESKEDIKVDLLDKVIKSIHLQNQDFYADDSIMLDVVDINKYIKCVRVHPLAKEWYVDLINETCSKYGICFAGKSSLYGDA